MGDSAIEPPEIEECLCGAKLHLERFVAAGNLMVVKDLILKGCNMNIKYLDGYKPIHVAAMKGHSNIVGYLLLKGVDVDSYDGNMRTPLHYAAKCGRIEIVKLLVRYGADFNCENGSKMKPMHYAAMNGHLDVVEYLYDSEAEFDSRNKVGHTPLLLAAVHAHREVVDFLVNCGADVNHFVIDRWTVLHHAALNGWTQIVRQLVHMGVQINSKTLCGETALLLAIANFHKSVVYLLIDGGANVQGDSDNIKWNVLHHATYLEWMDILRVFLQRMIDPNILNAQNSRGETPLLLAVKMGKIEVVDLFLDFGADINCVTESKWNLMHFAARIGCVDLMRLCLMKGCDIDARTTSNDTPLLIACSIVDMRSVEFLLKAGANSVAKNNRGDMPLNLLLKKRRGIRPLEPTKVIKLFVESGACLDYNSYCLTVPGPSILKEWLSDSNIVTKAFINRFNKKDLPGLYKLPISVYLPPLERLSFVNENVEEDILKNVKNQISTKGFCDLNEIQPMVLSMMCVRTLTKHYNRGSQNTLKRSISGFPGNQSVKMPRLE